MDFVKLCITTLLARKRKAGIGILVLSNLYFKSLIQIFDDLLGEKRVDEYFNIFTLMLIIALELQNFSLCLTLQHGYAPYSLRFFIKAI